MLDSSAWTSPSIRCRVSYIDHCIWEEWAFTLQEIPPIRSDADSPKINIYDGRADNKPLHTITDMHSQPVHLMAVREEKWHGSCIYIVLMSISSLMQRSIVWSRWIRMAWWNIGNQRHLLNYHVVWNLKWNRKRIYTNSARYVQDGFIDSM